MEHYDLIQSLLILDAALIYVAVRYFLWSELGV